MLHNADCFDVLQELPDNSIDAVITDPPYGTTACKWDTPIDLPEFWKQTKRVLRTPNSPVVVFADQPFTSNLIMSNPKWFRYEWLWDKKRQSNFANAWRAPFKHTEDIVVFAEKSPTYNIQQHLKPLPKTFPSWERAPFVPRQLESEMSNGRKHFTGFLWERLEFYGVRAKKTEKKHPAEKPLDLMDFLVGLYTNEGDVVLDPFMGSGTTGVACKNLNREFIGVEKEEEYFVKAGERLG